MNHHPGRRGFTAALALLLCGCASLQSVYTGFPPARPFHETIDLDGRISLHYQGPRQQEALHGSFTWNQSPQRTLVTLLSPLGQTLAVIEVTPDGATLTRSGAVVHSASDVDRLTAETLGWPLPVAGLRDWLQGRAIDTDGRQIVATPAKSELVTRDGWRLRYPAWDESGKPKRIDLAHSTEQAGDISIRIVIDTWQTH